MKKHGTEGIAAARLVAREKYAWPGGYTLALVMTDGETLCATCVRENFRQIAGAKRDGDHNGWNPAGLTHAGEWDNGEVCAHCGEIMHTSGCSVEDESTGRGCDCLGDDYGDN